ncbi:MAG: C-terminal binding protein [Eubacteriales bacterium]|nr:C-terminal binding protein [Eubacteriales bacterium]
MPELKAVVTDNRHKNYDIEKNILGKIGVEVIVESCKNEDEIIKKCADADAVLLDMAPMTARAIAGLRRCRVIVRYGVGYDNLDVDACSRYGIIASHVPDYCIEDVSDMTAAHIFACLRRTALKDRMVRDGAWNINAPNMFRLCGKRLTLIGFGRIARCVARKLSGFGLKEVIAYDPYVDEPAMTALGVRKVSLEDALKQGDIISLHLPVTKETKGIIDADAFSMMKDTAYLINTSRGPLVDEAALIAALENNKIAMAGLDTHCSEPLGQDHPLCRLDNCVLTDHTAFNTVEGVVELKTKVALAAKAVLEGGKPDFPLNKV